MVWTQLHCFCCNYFVCSKKLYRYDQICTSTGPITSLCLGPASPYLYLLLLLPCFRLLALLLNPYIFSEQSRFHFHHTSRSRLSIPLSKLQLVPGQVTKASSWDKPECLKNADEKLNTTSWKERLAITTKSLQSQTLVFGKFVVQSTHLTRHWSLCWLL